MARKAYMSELNRGVCLMKIGIRLLLVSCITFYTMVDVQAKPAKQSCNAEIIQSIGKQLKIEVLNDNLDRSNEGIEDWSTIISAAYKINPANPKQGIVAVVFNPNTNGSRADTLRYLITLINASSHKVLAYYIDGIEEDAGLIIESTSLWIDTAPYLVSKEYRAFGVDITSGYNPNCGSGGGGAVRTLYVRENKIIRPVLKDFETSNWQFIQRGKDRCTSDDEVSDSTIIENFRFSLNMEDTQSNGFRDILVSGTSSRDDGKITIRKPFRSILKYNGNEYPTENLSNKINEWENN